MRKKIIRYDIYKRDNWLIKIGYILLFVTLSNLLCSYLPKVEKYEDAEFYRKTAILLFLFIGSTTLLTYGYSVRFKENRINAILNNLKIALEVTVTDLISSTGYTFPQIKEAVREINRRGLGYYVLNKSSDSIADGRLRRKMVFVDKCTSCGKSIGENFPVMLNKVPTCKYCGNPMDINHWNDLKHRELKNIQEHQLQLDQANERKQMFFSPVIFVILAIFFWPGALIYLFLKYRKRKKLVNGQVL